MNNLSDYIKQQDAMIDNLVCELCEKCKPLAECIETQQENQK